MNDVYYFFRDKSMLQRLWKSLQPWVYPWSFPHEESSHLQDSNQTMCEKSDPVLSVEKDEAYDD